MPKFINPCFGDFLNELDGLKVGQDDAMNLVHVPCHHPFHGESGYVRSTLDTVLDAPLDPGIDVAPSTVSLYLRDVAVVPVLGSLTSLREIAVAVWTIFYGGSPECNGLSYDEIVARGEIVEKAPGSLYQITISRGDQKNNYSLMLDVSRGGISTVSGKMPGLPFLLSDNLQKTADDIARQTAPYVIAAH